MKKVFFSFALLFLAVVYALAAETASCQLEIKKGWCAYALDFSPDNDSLAKLRTVGKIYVWRDGRFKLLQNNEALDTGEGFFLKSEDGTSLELSGIVKTAGYLQNGWNLCSTKCLSEGDDFYGFDLANSSYVQVPKEGAEHAVWLYAPLTYMVVNLETGSHRFTNETPDLTNDTCRTTELWLRRIPKGTFLMGSPENELERDDDERQIQVTLTEDFYIGIFEMTQQQYGQLYYGNHPATCTGKGRPVECVTYEKIRGTECGAAWPKYGHAVDEDSFLGDLRKKTGLEFDLPTEAQWEYACRAGTTTSLNTGKNITNTGTASDPAMDEAGRYAKNTSDGRGGQSYYKQHTVVGCYLPNKWGLYDMHGNVYEWCLDRYKTDLGLVPLVDPVGGTTEPKRVIRGGAWDPGDLRGCRSADRFNWDPFDSESNLGFRVVVNLEGRIENVPTDYDWYTSFSNDFQEEVTGIVGNPEQASAFTIGHDSSMFGDGYLQVRKTTADTVGMEFLGTSNYFNYQEGNITISLWLRAPDYAKHSQFVLGNRPDDESDGFVFFCDHEDKSPSIDFRSRDNVTRSSSAVNEDGEWHNWIFVRYKNGDWRWYRDGNLCSDGDGDTGSICNSSSQNFKIGGGTNWNKEAVFDMAHLRIYGRVLSKKEIRALVKEFSAN